MDAITIAQAEQRRALRRGALQRRSAARDVVQLRAASARAHRLALSRALHPRSRRHRWGRAATIESLLDWRRRLSSKEFIDWDNFVSKYPDRAEGLTVALLRARFADAKRFPAFR